jgi:hypothetical protein
MTSIQGISCLNRRNSGEPSGQESNNRVASNLPFHDCGGSSLPWASSNLARGAKLLIHKQLNNTRAFCSRLKEFELELFREINLPAV